MSNESTGTQTVLFIGGPADGQRKVMRNPLPRVMRASLPQERRNPLDPVEHTTVYPYVEYELCPLCASLGSDRTYYSVYMVCDGGDDVIARLIAGYKGGDPSAR